MIFKELWNQRSFYKKANDLVNAIRAIPKNKNVEAEDFTDYFKELFEEADKTAHPLMVVEQKGPFDPAAKLVDAISTTPIKPPEPKVDIKEILIKAKQKGRRLSWYPI